MNLNSDHIRQNQEFCTWSSFFFFFFFFSFNQIICNHAVLVQGIALVGAGQTGCSIEDGELHSVVLQTLTSPTSTIEYGHESGGCLLLPPTIIMPNHFVFISCLFKHIFYKVVECSVPHISIKIFPQQKEWENAGLVGGGFQGYITECA